MYKSHEFFLFFSSPRVLVLELCDFHSVFYVCVSNHLRINELEYKYCHYHATSASRGFLIIGGRIRGNNLIRLILTLLCT